MSTDEEQIEALKRWWDENGSALLMIAAVAMFAWFGYRWWDNSGSAHALEASDIYQQITAIAANAPANAISAEDSSTVSYLAEQLIEDYDDTIYSRYAALFLAKMHVEADELEQAAAQLNWIMDNPKLGLMHEVEDALLLTARSRLARVVLAQGDAQRALDLLGAVEPGEFIGTYAEIEGDALMSLERRDEARAAYQQAVDAGNTSAILQLKLDDLGT